ncbi:SIS domain-containing protein [Streptomyces sp. G44]|uniref:SIS domain-containing protein n=1 Tax=Streptomyces sp. G44 TaxID=2807632 RepID=UPI0019620AF5|nr:SIS domain-containing protein [Streptomyces sp. G44]MBM7169445.1 SIS domain-containing protein [Streptomyces sp. G44]
MTQVYDLFTRDAASGFGAIDPGAVNQVVTILQTARRRRARVYVIGNGGSATTASHIACDLAKGIGRTRHERLRAVALSDSSALLTAWTNDSGSTHGFSGQLDTLLDPQDVVIAVSVSGNSANVLAGLDTARELGAATIGLLGSDGGRALHRVDVALHVPSWDYGVVETVHIGLLHALANALRGRPLSAPRPVTTEPVDIAVGRPQ